VEIIHRRRRTANHNDKSRILRPGLWSVPVFVVKPENYFEALSF